MLALLWLVPVVPLAGAVLLGVLGRRLPSRAVAVIGVGSIGIAALVTLLVGAEFLSAPPPEHRYVQTLWSWIEVGGFTPKMAFALDALSLLMLGVITGVGFLIHLYSAEFMADDEEAPDGYHRFFAYMNLFVAAMCTLVLGDNLLVLFLGWEGVGLCSYLLIGFWYRDPANGAAARKAFVVTRAGDTALLLGVFLLFAELGTLDIPLLVERAQASWAPGSLLPTLAALLLLGGALGKSAQLPLQTWLPDAMAGPTPVSALIHAATMVTAGVYLIARLHGLYELAPAVLLLIAVIGALTLLLAGASALVQFDIKRALAWSTVSQIGYMFLALGVGAWSAAMFHFMTHAFFKALLFLAAGAVIHSLHHEHDIRKMGGLRTALPLTFWSFVIGAASLAALPVVTAGFYSKDLILLRAWSGPVGGQWLWAAGLAGALLTAVYSFRVVVIAFLGEPHTPIGKRPGMAMQLPLFVLAVLAVIGGFVETPPLFGDVRLFSGLLQSTLPAGAHGTIAPATEHLLSALAMLVAVGGSAAAFLLYRRRRAETALGAAGGLRGVIARGWDFDALYDTLFVRPFTALARVNRSDIVDALYTLLAAFTRTMHGWLSATQSGLTRHYAAGLAVGAIVLIALALT